MIRTLLRRLLLSIPLLFIVSAMTFVLTALIPGDAAGTILGTTASKESLAALRKSLGLDQPIWVQYGHWVGNAFSGDLGKSVFTSEPVAQFIADALPVTLTLLLGAVIVATVTGIPLGVWSALRAKSGGRVIDIVSMIGYAIPPFFLGLLLALLFSNWLSLLPASGYVPFAEDPGLWFTSIILPVATLAIPGAAALARQTRQGMVEVLTRDYIRSLRARGISERSIVYQHALRNAAGNVVTALGLYVVSLLLGTTLVESVFAMQGLGSIAVRATNQHDLPVLEGAAVVFTIIVIIAFALVDLIRAWLNPKLRSR